MLYKKCGGDNGARTRDLLTASQTLSQLSYTPILVFKNYRILYNVFVN